MGTQIADIRPYVAGQLGRTRGEHTPKMTCKYAKGSKKKSKNCVGVKMYNKAAASGELSHVPYCTLTERNSAVTTCAFIGSHEYANENTFYCHECCTQMLEVVIGIILKFNIDKVTMIGW